MITYIYNIHFIDVETWKPLNVHWCFWLIKLSLDVFQPNIPGPRHNRVRMDQAQLGARNSTWVNKNAQLLIGVMK